MSLFIKYTPSTVGGGSSANIPGGSNGDIQYNNNGVFGGDTATTDGAGNISATSLGLSSLITVGNVVNAANVLNIKDSSDTTKVLALNVSGNTTGKTLTLASTQSNNETLTLPNILGADTVATLGLAQTFSGATTFSAAGTALTVTNNATVSGKLTTPAIINSANVLNIEDSADNTKIIALNASGNTTGKTLTLASAQTNSETLSFPNITGADTVATLGLAQTFSGATTFSASGTALTVSNNATVSGQLGVLSAALSTDNISVTGTTGLSGTSQRGVNVQFTSTSGGTSSVTGFRSALTTAASAAVTGVTNYSSGAPTVGASGSITRFTGIYEPGASNHAATNNASLADNSSYTGNWFLNQGGSDASKLGGALTVVGDVTIGGSVGTGLQRLVGNSSSFSVTNGTPVTFTLSAISPSSNAGGYLFIQNQSVGTIAQFAIDFGTIRLVDGNSTYWATSSTASKTSIAESSGVITITNGTSSTTYVYKATYVQLY